MSSGTNNKGKSNDNSAQPEAEPAPTPLRHQSYVGPRPGAYREGPGGTSVRATAASSREDVEPSNHPRRLPSNEREPEVLLEAEPVLSIVNATPVPVEQIPVETTLMAPIQEQPRQRVTRRTIVILAVLTAIAAAIVAVTVGVVLGVPKPSATLLEQFNATLPPSTMERIQDTKSPQRRAYKLVTKSVRDDEPIGNGQTRLFQMTQRFSLATLFYSIDGLEGAVNSTMPECQWGVSTPSSSIPWLPQSGGEVKSPISCNSDSLVVAFRTPSVSAYINGGTLPPEIGLLTGLTSLDLASSRFRSSIPTEMGHLSALTSIDLSLNHFSSSIPTELGQLVGLQVIDLRYNELPSSVPSELGLVSPLIFLGLTGNQLKSSIPTELGLLTSLKGLALSHNQLNSSIPAELGLLSSLTYLGLENNALTSTIPTELGKLKKLNQLRLKANDLTGTFPSNLCYIGPGAGGVSGNYLGIYIDCSKVSCKCCNCST